MKKPVQKTRNPRATPSAMGLRHIHSIAERIWRHETDASEWLNSPHPELRGATPLSLLKTVEGERIVEALLGALEFGMPA